jgi:hypothetical protein
MNVKMGVLAIAAGLIGALLFSQSQRTASMPHLVGAVGGSTPVRSAQRLCSEKSCWSISGRIHASTPRGRCLT